MTVEQEAAHWDAYFMCGSWLLAGTVEALGFANDVEMDEAAGDAWNRLGHIHLDRKQPGEKCWALATFGDPDHGR